MIETYIYPAVLTFEDGAEIAVTFPDLPGCATCGEDEADALRMGQDALCLHLYGMEQDGEPIPPPSKVRNLRLGINEATTFIIAPMQSFRKTMRPAS